MRYAVASAFKQENRLLRLASADDLSNLASAIGPGDSRCVAIAATQASFGMQAGIAHDNA